MKILPTLINVEHSGEGSDFPTFPTFWFKTQYITNVLFDGNAYDTMFNKQNELGSLFVTSRLIRPIINLVELQSTHTEYSGWDMKRLADCNYLIVEYDNDYFFYFVNSVEILNVNQCRFDCTMDEISTYFYGDIFNSKEVEVDRMFTPRLSEVDPSNWRWEEGSDLHIPEYVAQKYKPNEVVQTRGILFNTDNFDIDTYPTRLLTWNTTQWLVIYSSTNLSNGTLNNNPTAFGTYYEGFEDNSNGNKNQMEMAIEVTFAPLSTMFIRVDGVDYVWNANQLWKAYAKKLKYSVTDGKVYFQNDLSVTVTDHCPFDVDGFYLWEEDSGGQLTLKNGEDIPENGYIDGWNLSRSFVDDDGTDIIMIRKSVVRNEIRESTNDFQSSLYKPKPLDIDYLKQKNYKNEPKLYLEDTCYLQFATTSMGEVSNYAVNYFYNEEAKVKLEYSTQPESFSARHYFDCGKYSGDHTSLNYGFWLNNNAQLPRIDNSYKTFLDNHKASAVGGMAVSGLMAVGSLAGAFFTGGATAGGAISSGVGFADKIMQRVDLKNKPTKTVVGNAPLFDFTRNNLRTYIHTYMITESDMKQLSQYFHQMGYQQNQLFALDTRWNDRYYFNYFEIPEVTHILNKTISAENRNKIVERFARGVRLWHYRGSTWGGVGNYYYDNTEVV